MQVKRRRASGIERDNPSGVERRSTSGVVQKRAEKLNYALAVLLSLLCPGTPLAPRSPAAQLRPSSPSSNSSSSRTGNRQIFCYLRINIFIEFASVDSERERGVGKQERGVGCTHGCLVSPVLSVDSFWAFVFRACQKLCKYACHFHLPIAVRRRALSAGQTVTAQP